MTEENNTNGCDINTDVAAYSLSTGEAVFDVDFDGLPSFGCDSAMMDKNISIAGNITVSSK